MTAVFALVVGIVLTLGANPGAAQPQARAHVYLLRGLFNVLVPVSERQRLRILIATCVAEAVGRAVHATITNIARRVPKTIGREVDTVVADVAARVAE